MSLVKKVLLAFLPILLFCGCEDNSKIVEQKKKTLIMGTSADYPPFEFIKDRKIRGFDIDLANDIAKKLGYSIVIKDMNFDSLVPALQTGRIDFAMSGFSNTLERDKHVDFSVSYYIPTYAMLYNKDKPIPTINDLNNVTIGAQLGSTMEHFLKTQEKSHQNLKIISLARVPSMVQELKLKRIDGVVMESAQAKVYVNKNSNFDYSMFSNTGEGYSIVFPKGSPLKDHFDEAIIKLRDAGKLDDLKEKWLF